MLKTIFLNALKIFLAAGLLYWLVSSGKLDFKLLLKLRDYPFAVFGAIFLTVTNYILVSYRWETILRARAQVHLPILDLLKITWIGQFFSSVLPGSVSGDLVKILYVQKTDSSFSKKFIFASILIDRAMGLSGLILLVGLCSLVFRSHILSKSPGLEQLLEMNYLLVLIVLVSLIVFFLFHGVVRASLVRIEKLLPHRIFAKITTLWDDLVLIKSKMIKAVALSLIIQFIGVVIFWILIAPFVGEHMDFVQALAFIPIGLMTLALPVAPSGLGVGHAIFQKLFEFSGITNGASLFNLYFVVTLTVNVFGVIPYLLTKVKND
jgi:uncharacterized membrane protein YbhN (UPF0104 family)